MEEKDIIETYIDRTSWKVKENANTGFSISGMQLQLTENVTKKYMLNHIYTRKIADAHRKNYIYIHDLGLGLQNYCMGHDLQQIVEEGFNGVPGKVSASPPKHLRTAVNQLVNYLFTLQSEHSGAQALNNFDTLLAPFVVEENLGYKEIKQCMQELIYSMNVPNRTGFQCPFTNVTFDLKCPEHLKTQRPKINNKFVDFTYGDCNEEIGMIAKAFFEIMMEGDDDGKPFTFPIPTINLHKDFVWDDDIAMVIFEATAKYGIPNFQNFVNSDLDPSATYSMCCRLSLRKDELVKNSGGIFGTGIKTGSIGVVTLNLPRIGYVLKNNDNDATMDKIKEEIEKYMEIAKDCLETKRKIINNNLEIGLFPYTDRYIKTFNNHFSTIGLVGGNELLLNYFDTNITTNRGQELMEELLQFMSDKISSFQKETGNYYNLEQTPAESAAYKLARQDLKEFPDIKTSGGDGEPYYTNSTHYPASHKKGLFKMLEAQDKLNSYYNGGTIVHVFLGQKITDWINCMMLVKKIADNTSLPFFSITPSFSICPVHGYISGVHKYCPLSHTDEDLKTYGVFIEEEDKT